MGTPGLSFSPLSRAIQHHIKERLRLEAQLKEIEARAALVEEELNATEKECSDARMKRIMLNETKQLLLNKLEAVNAKNDRLQKIFTENQEAEHKLEVEMSKCQNQRELERNLLNGELLRLQNPIFTELIIRETEDFNIPEVDIEALQAKQPTIQKTV
ncbi:hypothetical protein ECG_02153 [Echinococcus granulosus]|uniref:Expressed protein n=1 Tax=Echinococcus granulosus TaxID=6210 RepID=A0A068WNZ1_ECHGR|nr:hypothetical protein ECG_02153 [Echinococcus granulosus]CDS21808.1 expressed protein [Echinococcus granulosus]